MEAIPNVPASDERDVVFRLADADADTFMPSGAAAKVGPVGILITPQGNHRLTVSPANQGALRDCAVLHLSGAISSERQRALAVRYTTADRRGDAGPRRRDVLIEAGGVARSFWLTLLAEGGFGHTLRLSLDGHDPYAIADLTLDCRRPVG